MKIENKAKIVSKNKQLVINIIASFIAFAVSMGINFFLSPYIVKTVGTEAYGFVQLSNNFITYFSVLTIALNSMSSRFISIAYYKNNMLEANQYFSSTFFSNVILNAVLVPIIFVGILNINHLVNVSPGLVIDVQFLMGFMAISLFVELLSTNLGISYYVKNKLYISSIVNIAGNIIRAVLLLVLFVFFKPYIAFIGLVTVIIIFFTQLFNIYYKRKLIPELIIRKRYFQFIKVKELIFSGIWNTITRVGSLLSEGLDLLITNLFIGAADMGILAIAKMVPNMINNILNTMISTFIPNLTELYAQNRKQELVKYIKQSMKIIGMLINIPIAGLIAYGDVLFTLWFPKQDAHLLQILSIMTIFPWAIMGQATIIHNVFTIVNKIKLNSILVCLTGLLNVLVVFILLKTTTLGLFAIAGVSSIFSIIRNLVYTVPFGAIYIKCKWYTFFSEIIKSVLSVTTVSIVGCLLKTLMPTYSWLNLFLFAALTTIFGLIFNCMLVLNKNDRIFLYGLIIKKLKRNER
ncbi:MAG: oligosaccharide flippase family protein [Clostridiaceae bacterium]